MKQQPFSHQQFSQGFSARHARERKKWWQRMFAFLFSRKGLVLVLIVLPLVLLIWLYSILGPLRPFFGNLPGIGGLIAEKTYLVLLHNENELRPTGGFITSFAILRLHGLAQSIEFFNSEQVMIPEPRQQAPEAVERVLSRDAKYAGWVFRDTNFDLDFSTNARRALQFLQFDPEFADEEFDGVIGLDLHFLSALIDLFGPFAVNGQEVTGSNLFAVLQQEAKNFDHHDREAWMERKSAFAPLGQQLLSAAKSSPTKWAEFFEILGQNAAEKHLLFFFRKTGWQEKFARQNWTGEIPPESFWSVNLANLGGRKGDRFLRQNWHSSLHVQPNGVIEERFSMHLAHEGTYNLQSDRYEAFVRIVRPAGTELLDTSGELETAPEQNEQTYGTEISFFVVLLPGEEKLLTFDFALPEETVSFARSGELPVQLIKQAGTLAPEWDFTLRGENDPVFSAAGCDRDASRENVLFCETELITDRRLIFTQHPDSTPPLLQFARFTSLNSAEIRFSEDIFPEIELTDITLTDLDHVRGTTDEIALGGVEVQGEKITFTFSGMSANPGEWFRLNIRNLRDLSGNFFAGETEGIFAVTMVQE